MNRTWATSFATAATAAILLSLATAPSATAESSSPRPLSNDCSAGYVSFTFDDGPDVNTPTMVSTLATLNVPATFFVLGQKIDNNPTGQATVANEVAHG